MYYLLSLISGILISVMVAINGGLTETYGVYSATVIIHIAGLLLVSILTLTKRERSVFMKKEWFLYLGGAIGVMTTVFNNLAYGRISVSAILALGLFGQSVTSLIIDQYGLMNMPKHPFSKRKICGLLLCFCGILSMINNFDILAVVVSFMSGVTIVISRTLNAKLADSTSIRISTFYNYLIGLIVAVPVYFLFGSNEVSFTLIPASPKLYIYFGGILGVCVVLLSNMTVTKISAFYLSLFLFLGQVFSGILVDAIILQAFSPQNLIGGIFVAIGLCANLIFDNKHSDDRLVKHHIRKKIFANTVYAKRPKHIIVCPRCKTEQSKEQDVCCSCKTVFIFLDETNKYCV